MGRWLLIAALAAVVVGARAGAPHADQGDARLDRLFVALETTGDAAEGERLGREIASIWDESGRAEVDFLMQEGRWLMDQGRFLIASQRYLLVTSLAPDFAEGWNKRAHASFRTGDLGAAIAHIRAALVLEPRHFLALAGLGVIYLQLGEDELALDTFDKALAINPHLLGTRQKAEELRRTLDGEGI